MIKYLKDMGKILPRAKHWDGHTEKDAMERLVSLEWRSDMSISIGLDWRKNLADEIRSAANNIFEEADRLADQPEYMTDYGIWIRFPPDGPATYEVSHSHVVPGGNET